jgi:hypothetical protein
MRFSYTTLSEVRAFGISSLELSDKEVLRLIKLYSDRFNRLTGRVFAPLETKMLLDGGNILYKLSGSPVLKVKGVTSLYSDGSRTPISPMQYSINDYTLLKLEPRLREGLANVEVLLVQGEMEGMKEVEVSITSTITSGTTEFGVDSADQLEIRDVLVFGSVMFIINDIDYSNNMITIDDPGNIKPIPMGSKTTVYGQVPMLVEEAIKLFVKNHKSLQTQKSGFKSESIGNYSYTKADGTTGYTGITEIDSIINLFNGGDDVTITYL